MRPPRKSASRAVVGKLNDEIAATCQTALKQAAELAAKLAHAENNLAILRAILTARDLTLESYRGRIADLSGDLTEQRQRAARLQEAFLGVSMRLGAVEAQRLFDADSAANEAARGRVECAGQLEPAP